MQKKRIFVAMKAPLSPTPILSKEELANILTHSLALLGFAVATPILIGVGLQTGTWYQVLGLGIFCLSLLLVYSSSTAYHCMLNERLKHIFRIIDHICIYFLIAGTHTPFVLLYVHRPAGWIFLTGLWLMVLVGTLFKLFFIDRFQNFSLLLYLVMGWSGLLFLPQMFSQMTGSAYYWAIAGGLSYSVGVIFYVWERLPYHHAIWHLFVIGGSAGHFMALVYCFVENA